jgi:CrcB protein
MGFAFPGWGEPPEAYSALITPANAAAGGEVGFTMNALWIFLGSGLGGLARWGVSGLVANMFGATFPWGTLTVNITGSFVIGLFATATAADGRWFAPSTLREFVMIGICGGYTTFSSFSLQTLELADRGEWLKAGANSVLSFVLCLVAVWLGHALAMQLNSLKGH